MVTNNQKSFLALVRAGLWETEARLSQYKDIDYAAILQLAEDQSLVGLVTAGLEHATDVKVPQDWVLQFVGETLQIEQQDKEMNSFLSRLIEKMRGADIYSLLVKGQGIAQCYERPFWRASGDVDLFLSEGNYLKAKELLLQLGELTEPEELKKRHLSINIKGWIVELHGTLHSGLSSRIDHVLDDIQREVFYDGNVRSWMNGSTQIFLMNETCDAVYVFTHILQHFYKGGIGLRQICDWCRLLWTYKDSLNYELLESRIRKAGLMSEWKAFASLAVDYLGMPADAMPMFNENDINNPKWNKKAERILKFVLETGNFGHNRDSSYFHKYPFFVRKSISMGRRCGDLIQHAKIFPWDSIRFFPSIIFNGLRSAATGE